MTEEAYYDTDNNLTDTAMGYAMAVYTYDELGNQTDESFYDAKSLGVKPKDAEYARHRTVHDHRHRRRSRR